VIKLKRFLRGVLNFFQVVIVFYVVIVTSFILFKNEYGYTEMFGKTFVIVDSVDSRNIKGTNRGDLLIVEKNKSVKKGDFIYYYSVLDKDYIVKKGFVSQFVSSKDVKGSVVDNSSTPVLYERVIGNKAKRIPYLGMFFSTVTGKLGFLLYVMVPILIVFIYQLCEFIFLMKDKDSSIHEKNSGKVK